MWTKPTTQDIDAWEKLGNPGWNWSRYDEYCKKAEKSVKAKFFYDVFLNIVRFTSHAGATDIIGHPINISSHGLHGYVKTSLPPLACEVEIPFRQVCLTSLISHSINAADHNLLEGAGKPRNTNCYKPGAVHSRSLMNLMFNLRR